MKSPISVPNETYQISPKPKTAFTTEIPWLYTGNSYDFLCCIDYLHLLSKINMI